MIQRFLVTLTVLMVAAACGTVATPEPQAVATEEVTRVAAVATNTPVPPTVAPPTSTPVPPTIAPTEAPTVAPTEAVSASSGEYGEGDPQKFAVDNFADTKRGEALFNQNFEVDGIGWMCSTCHNVDSEVMKIGPGLLNIRDRALTRVAGEGPYTYLYNSIIHSQDYIVEGFEAGTKMPAYEGILTNSQVYDLIAYLLTFTD